MTTSSLRAAVVVSMLLSPGISTAQSIDATQFRSAVQRAEADRFEGVIAVGDATRLLHAAAIGRADRERGVAHTIDERWLWASVTKQVTAVLVMGEVERGRFALDTRVSTVLPSFRDAAHEAITVRQLLQHTAGLANPDDTEASEGVPVFYRQTGPTISNTARAEGYCAGPVKAVPGAAFEYNNCDYLVLGTMLERSTGRSYGDLVAERIAKPEGLTTVALAADRLRDEATGIVGYDATARSPDVNVATFGAAGALTGSAADLLAFDRALLAGRLLGKAATGVLWTGDPKLGYEALGVWAFEARLKGCAKAIRLIERRGDVAGIQVRNVIAPDLGLAMVAFTNRDDLDFGEVWQGRGLSFDLLSGLLCAVVGGDK